MERLDEHLSRWAEAGLITRDQGQTIAVFEQQRGSTSEQRPATPSLTSPAEAIGYVGAALALGAIALILGDLWQELLIGGRLALVAVLTVALFGGGLGVRAAVSPAMERLTSVLFTASVAGVGWFAGVVAWDVLSVSDAAGGVIVGLAMLATASPLYVWKRRALLQLAVAGSALTTAVSLLGLSELSPGAAWYGLVVAAVGAVWFLLAVGRWLEPRVVGEVVGALIVFAGVQIAAFEYEGGVVALVLGVAIAAGLVTLAVRSDALHHLVIGALALFVLSPQLVFEIFGDAIGAPATLLLVGLLLVLLAVGLGRARREVVRDTANEGGVLR